MHAQQQLAKAAAPLTLLHSRSRGSRLEINECLNAGRVGAARANPVVEADGKHDIPAADAPPCC